MRDRHPLDNQKTFITFNSCILLERQQREMIEKHPLDIQKTFKTFNRCILLERQQREKKLNHLKKTTQYQCMEFKRKIFWFQRLFSKYVSCKLVVELFNFCVFSEIWSGRGSCIVLIFYFDIFLLYTHNDK